MADQLVDFYNSPSTIRFSGRTRIPAGSTVGGDVAILGGPVELVGEEDSVFPGAMVRDISAQASFDLGGASPVDVVGVLSFNPLTTMALPFLLADLHRLM